MTDFMTFTARDLRTALGQDGHLINGEKADYYDNVVEAFWWEEDGRGTIDVLGLGEFESVESYIGKEGQIAEYNGDYTVWANYIILKHLESGRFFRLPGEYDSWDAQGWNGEVEEVKQVEKTIKVWE